MFTCSSFYIYFYSLPFNLSIKPLIIRYIVKLNACV